MSRSFRRKSIDKLHCAENQIFKKSSQMCVDVNSEEGGNVLRARKAVLSRRKNKSKRKSRSGSRSRSCNKGSIKRSDGLCFKRSSSTGKRILSGRKAWRSRSKGKSEKQKQNWYRQPEENVNEQKVGGLLANLVQQEQQVQAAQKVSMQLTAGLTEEQKEDINLDIDIIMQDTLFKFLNGKLYGRDLKDMHAMKNEVERLALLELPANLHNRDKRIQQIPLEAAVNYGKQFLNTSQLREMNDLQQRLMNTQLSKEKQEGAVNPSHLRQQGALDALFY